MLGWMFDHYDMMLFAYVASAIGKEWEWGDSFTRNKALLLGTALFTSGVGGVVFGGLADRYGRRRVMGWTILVYSLSTGLSGLAWGLVSLAFLRAITGFGFGGEWATGQALLAEVFPRNRRGVASALLQAGQPLGAVLAVLSGLWLGPHIGWRWVFALGAAPAALVLLLRRYVPESPLWLAQSKQGRPSLVEPYVVLLRDHWRRTVQGLVLGASKLGTFWLTFVWLPDYFLELERKRLADTGITTEGFADLQRNLQLGTQVALVVGMLLFGPLADRLTAMGTVYNVSRSFQVVTQGLMVVTAAGSGVASGLLLAAGFAFITATWVWTLPETRGIELRSH
jgi:MFS family permease